MIKIANTASLLSVTDAAGPEMFAKAAPYCLTKRGAPMEHILVPTGVAEQLELAA